MTLHQAWRSRRLPAALAATAAATLLLLAGVLPLPAASRAGAATGTSATSGLAYDLVSADGTVSSFGGAGYYGGLESVKLRMPVVGMAVTPDGRGYWIVTANGSVYGMGDAHFYGSPGRGPLPNRAHRVIALVPTKNGRGYWLCNASGGVRAYGDAPKIPSLTKKQNRARQPIVGFSVEPNQHGAWVVTDKGVIWRLGKVRNYGGLGRRRLSTPIVSLARNTAGTGYWMLGAKGQVFSFGGTRKVHYRPSLVGAAVGLAVAPDARGIWGVSSGGSMLNAGVPSLGRLSGLSGGRLIVGIATAVPLPDPPTAYDLLQANGTVTSFGGAGNFGGTENIAMSMPAVGMALTPDGRGYWIVTANGSVYNIGDAGFYGSTGKQPLPATPAQDTIALVPTPDGQGYWLCTASGVVRAYGDAPSIPSLPASYAGPPIVAFAVLPGGTGALVVNSAGDVYPLGKAGSYGSLAGHALPHPIVSMALTPDGRGYWLVDSAGDVYAFGDASSPLAPPALSSAVVGIAAAPGGIGGYWLVTSAGTLVAAGAPSGGAPPPSASSSPVVAIAATVPLASTQFSPYPPGSYGYDVSWPQCNSKSPSEAGSLPGPPFAVAFVGVDGWAFGADNNCLQAEISWAEQARLPGSSVAPQYQLYIFLNSPSGVNSTDSSGPAGSCQKLTSPKRAACYAYNYGYNSAVGALAYAASQGAKAPVWWLDIENDSCSSKQWSGGGAYWSCTPSLNDRTIQGAIDALRGQGMTVGVYSTAQQWNIITDHFVPSGAQLPLWIAGAPWTSPPYPSSSGYPSTAALSNWCAGYYDFAGGVPSMLQETPGSNNYPFDPDYAC